MAAVASAPAVQPVSTASSHPFTCNTCQVAFRSSDLQRTHMQSDWHRYNLKRRVASLPPLTSEVFSEKVLANKATAAATAARASFEKRCEPCEKTYYSEGAYVNHIASQKHKIATTRYHARVGHETESMADSTFSLVDPIDNASTTASTVTATAEEEEDDDDIDEELAQVVEGVSRSSLSNNPSLSSNPAATSEAKDANNDEDEEYEHKANLAQCLFCNYVSPTPDLSLLHMSRQHGFFIPEREYVVDLPGLITYLSETICVLHQCLYCHKIVHTESGVQTHMRDRGHCMIAYDTEEDQLEVGEFYDFRSTYSDEETDDEDAARGGVSLGAKRPVKTTVKNDKGEDVEMDDEDEEGWESDSTVSSVPTDEITSLPIDPKRPGGKPGLSRKDSRPHKNSDGFHSHARHGTQTAYHDEYELYLPTGRTAGHRSLRQYFRQNLRNYPTPEERQHQQRIESGRHDSDADDEDASASVVSNGTERERGRGRQMISRADGGMGMIGVSEAKKREIRAVEKREKKREQRAEARYQWGKDKRGNNQKHFRDHLLQ